MRPWARVALACLALTACGKKDSGATGAAPQPSAGPATTTTTTTTTAAAAASDALKVGAAPALPPGVRAEPVPTGPTVVVTKTAVVFEGERAAAVDGGQVDPAELMGGSTGTRISRLEQLATMQARLPEATKSEAVLVVIDPELPSKLAQQVARTFRAAGQHRVAFIVRTPEGPGAVPVTVPSQAPSMAGSSPGQPPDQAPLGLVVALLPDRVLVVSLSRLEGTLADPRLDLRLSTDGTWPTKLRDDLAEIVERRWGGRARPESLQTIYVIADDAVSSGDLVAAVAAVRHDAKGNVLFPDVQLMSGIELAFAPERDELDKAPTRDPAEAAAEAEARKRIDAVAFQEDSAWVDVLVASEGREGVGEGDLSKRAPGSDLAEQVEAARDREHNATPTPMGRIAVAGKKALDDTSLAVDDTLRKIQTVYMAGLKRCYKHELKKDPTLRERAELAFAVGHTGRTIRAKVTAMTLDFSRCVEGQMTSWVFSVPRDADGEATEASFIIVLALTPD